MKLAIIINKHRMTDALAEKLGDPELGAKYHLTYDVFIREAEEIPSLLSDLNHAAYNAYVIGGGDGSVRMAIEGILGKNIPLAILPLGTFNILAKSLDYPNDIDALFEIIKNNKTKKIDIANVNGRIISNHSWIGFYYNLLKRRKKYRHIVGTNRLFKIIFAFSYLFNSLTKYTLDLKIDGKICQYQTCLIFIGNNDFQVGFFDFGQHKYLSTGLLSVTILNCQTRWQLIKFIFSVFLFQKFKPEYVTSFTTDNLVITSKKDIVKMVIDGELYKLKSPLHFNIHHHELTVFTV